MKIPIKIIVIIFALLIINSCSGNEEISVKDGIIDLCGYDFENDKPVNLSGGWEFYWMRYLNPEEFERNERRTVYFGNMPGMWTNYSNYPRPISVFGYATYRIKIKLDSSAVDQITFRVPSINTPLKLFFNGNNIASSGVAGVNKQTTRSGGGGQIVTVPVTSDLNELIIHVSNYNIRYPGVKSPLIIGSCKRVSQAVIRDSIINAVILGMTLVFGLIFFVTYLFARKMKSLLYFAFICFLYGLRPLLSSSLMSYLFMIINDFEVLSKVEYLTVFTPFILFPLFFDDIFKGVVHRYIKYIILTVTAVLLIVVISSPVAIFEYTYFAYRIVGLVCLTVYSALLIVMIRRKSVSALILMIGVSFFVLCVLNDVLVGLGWVFHPYLLNYGFIFFIICEFAALIRVSSIYYDKYNKLSDELVQKINEIERINQNLQESINERTHSMMNRNNELKHALEALSNERDNFLKNKKESISSFLVRGVAHELKNPLNFIINFSDIAVKLCDELILEIKENEDNFQIVDEILKLKKYLTLITDNGMIIDHSISDFGNM